MSVPAQVAEALVALDELTRRLRRECPWDREQDERSVVPHTVEEAYELADAAQRGDDDKLRDELGDVLFQVHFLSLLLEERGAGDMAVVAEGVCRKLIRRHPHVFASAQAQSAGEVLANWDAIKDRELDREPGIFGEVPENLPALLYARKVQRRAAGAGRHPAADTDAVAPLDVVRRQAAALSGPASREARFEAMGELLFAAVDVARRLGVDPELSLRAGARRFRARVEATGAAHSPEPTGSGLASTPPASTPPAPSAPGPSPPAGGSHP